MWRSRASLTGLLLVLMAPACTGRPAPGGAAPAATTVAGALRFIEDDAPLALAEAKKRGVPLFVEAWAPW